jgi:lipopolysaccharide/colanic/teichoic acid biosynthesis glycosyltransferase
LIEVLDNIILRRTLKFKGKDALKVTGVAQVNLADREPKKYQQKFKTDVSYFDLGSTRSPNVSLMECFDYSF